MTPILSFLPCADVSDASDRAIISVAAISPHTKRTDRYGNMGSSPEGVGRQPLCAGIRSWSSDNVKRMDGGKWYVRRHEPRGDRSRRARWQLSLPARHRAVLVGRGRASRIPGGPRDAPRADPVARWLRAHRPPPRPEGRPRAALCAIELRSPTPFSFEGFERVLEENLDVWAV